MRCFFGFHNYKLKDTKAGTMKYISNHRDNYEASISISKEKCRRCGRIRFILNEHNGECEISFRDLARYSADIAKEWQED